MNKVAGPMMSADIIQFPVLLNSERIQSLFGNRLDIGDGLPRARFIGCSVNHGFEWTPWVRVLQTLMASGIEVTYYAIECRFEVSYPCPLGC